MVLRQMKPFASQHTLPRLFLFAVAVATSVSARGANPVVQTNFTADPAPMVHDGVLYLYTSHDEDDAPPGMGHFRMLDWKCYSSTDMANWTDNGTVASLATFPWAVQDNDAWAPQVVERGGRFYLYVPISVSGQPKNVIAVAVADSPLGPFKDALGHPLIDKAAGTIDPTVFVDDDGQAYLYWGNPNLWYVKLNRDMISYSGDIVKEPTKPGNYQEGPWFYKRNGHYYLAYASTCCPEGIGYAMSDGPTGPWVYKGHIMQPNEGSSGNHPAIVDYKGGSYAFGFNYRLNFALTDKHRERRSVCVAKFDYNPDGTIPTLPWWNSEGVPQIGALNPYERTEAETICWSEGIKSEPCSEGGLNVYPTQDGAYIKVKGVDFGDEGAGTFTASVACGATAGSSKGGSIELHLDSVVGPLIGTLSVPDTGGQWKIETTAVTGPTGTHDLFLVFRTAPTASCFKADYWQFTHKTMTTTAAGVHLVPTTTPDTPAKIYPLDSVRLLDEGPFFSAVKANRDYVLALDPDRLLAPFRREAGLPLKVQPYGNWESSGLDGHTAGHYLSALSHMIAAGEDTPDGELRRRLDSIIDGLGVCQEAGRDGYIAGVPDGRKMWAEVASGDDQAIFRRWAPWYNLHKTFAGLRDAYLEAGNIRARDILVRFGDWSVAFTSRLTDAQMQRMLSNEHGGMNEVMADIYAITGDRKYLATAERFNHRAILDPLIRHQDQLTGKHANTQIPKVIGLERIATLTGDKSADSGARFFWETVTQHRSVAFGGNSVSEHFNDPHDFHGMLLHREGPETCNTYNMLRLTEGLFASAPSAAYADYYERALYNHILASINPTHPGYVYFTPIRPDHYRVYSVPGEGFWCCVGTGMENPGRYGQFIYARARDGIYVNLFIASELKDSPLGLTVRQDTAFPDEERTRLTLKLARPQTFTLYLREPGWVAPGSFTVTVNGDPMPVIAPPSSYVSVRREWRDGDRVEIGLPMHTTEEGLPDGSPWYAILHGPILLAHPAGTWELTGLRADDTRMAHVPAGPEVPLDQAPELLANAGTIPSKVVADPSAGPLHFRLVDVVEPPAPNGLDLIPFFRLHDSRYQMYWEVTTREGLAVRKDQLAADERARAAREAATIDSVAPGEQQPEVEHAFQGVDTETGIHNGRHWRHGRQLQYSLSTRGEKSVVLSVTYSGDDSDRTFAVFANDTLIATQDLVAEKLGEFVEKLYVIPAAVLASAPDGRVTIRFVARKWLAGGVYDVRLLRPNGAAPTPPLTR